MSLKEDKMVNKFIKPGMVVILIPHICRNEMLSGCMMTITEVKDWGCQGYIQATGGNGKMGGQVYYRAKWDEMEFVGFSNFKIEGEEE